MYLIQLIDVNLAGLFAFVAHSSSIWGYVVRKETHKVLYDDYDYEYDDDDDGSPAYSHQSKSHHSGVLTVMITVGDLSPADSHH